MITSVMLPRVDYPVHEISEWMEEQLGPELSWQFKRDQYCELMVSEDLWVRYLDPGTDMIFHLIKDRPEVVLLFKLTWGGKIADQ